MEVISPEILDKLLAYPILLLIIIMLWVFDRITGRLIELAKLLSDLKERG